MNIACFPVWCHLTGAPILASRFCSVVITLRMGGYHGRNATEFFEGLRNGCGVGSLTFQYGRVS